MRKASYGIGVTRDNTVRWWLVRWCAGENTLGTVVSKSWVFRHQKQKTNAYLGSRVAKRRLTHFASPLYLLLWGHYKKWCPQRLREASSPTFSFRVSISFDLIESSKTIA